MPRNKPCFDCIRRKKRCVRIQVDSCEACRKKDVPCLPHIPWRERNQVLMAAFGQSPQAASQNDHNSYTAARPEHFVVSPTNQEGGVAIYRRGYQAQDRAVLSEIQLSPRNDEGLDFGTMQHNSQPDFVQEGSSEPPRPDAPYLPYTAGPPQLEPQVQASTMNNTGVQEGTFILSPFVRGGSSQTRTYGLYDGFQMTGWNALALPLNSEQSASQNGHDHEQGGPLQPAYDNVEHIQHWNNGS